VSVNETAAASGRAPLRTPARFACDNETNSKHREEEAQMEAKPLVTSGRLAPATRRRSWSMTVQLGRRRQRPIQGSEIELLKQLGELPRGPREQVVDRSMTRWRWM
jgi:hypothetical protein